MMMIIIIIIIGEGGEVRGEIIAWKVLRLRLKDFLRGFLFEKT